MENKKNNKINQIKSKTEKKSILYNKNQGHVIEKDQNCGKLLNRILILLYILTILFLVNLVFNILNMGNTSKLSNYVFGENVNSMEGENESENADYDVSKFKAVTYEQLSEDIKSSEYTVVYIGRASCGYCVKYIPILLQGQEEFGFTTEYFDITQIIDFSANTISDQEAFDKFSEMDDYIKENFGATPMVLVFKDGEYVNGTVGYTEYDIYKTFLENSGLSK